ncbi:MAG: hypothetical protein JNM80_07440 [Phycisphaerae bacterium]|nr:hypothetical protein [Phycisphaerae bacterium]
MSQTRAARAAMRRRGGVYFAVLGASMLMGLIGVGVVAEMRAQRQATIAAMDGIEARFLADSAVQAAVVELSKDPNWRSRPAASWASPRALGRGTVSLRITGTSGTTVSGNEYEPVLLTGVGVKGSARQMTQVRLGATGVPLDSLSLAMHADGEIEVLSGAWLTVTGAPIATHSTLLNDGTFVGTARAKARAGGGLLVGTVAITSQQLTVARASAISFYADVGTAIAPANGVMENLVLSAGVNPMGGGVNADGVYVVRTSKDLTIRNCRIKGTLVVICSDGAAVHLADRVFIHPHRADYPALLVAGDLFIEIESAAATLQESTVGVNFNPAGAPYQGVSDSDTTDSYPSEVRGLVHATGLVTLSNTATVRGVILSSLTGSTAVSVEGNNQLIWDSTIAANPPMGYTESVRLSVQPGTWARVVDP